MLCGRCWNNSLAISPGGNRTGSEMKVQRNTSLINDVVYRQLIMDIDLLDARSAAPQSSRENSFRLMEVTPDHGDTDGNHLACLFLLQTGEKIYGNSGSRRRRDSSLRNCNFVGHRLEEQQGSSTFAVEITRSIGKSRDRARGLD